MASVAIVHYTHFKNSNGSSPIIIRVIVNRKPFKRTIANVFPNQWNEDKKRVIPKSHDNYASINIRISNEYNRIEKLILENKFDLQRDFIDYFANLKAGIETKVETEKKLSFKELIPIYATNIKSGFSVIEIESRLNYFVRIAGINNERISEVKKAHIEKAIAFMEAKGNKRSTMRTNLNVVRYLSSFAVREGYDTKSHIIHTYPFPIPERTVKQKLTKDELKAFKGVVLTDDTKIREIQDMFVLAVYLRGMRVGDLIQLRQEYFFEDRLIYESGKNKKLFNIKLIPDAIEIVNRYLDKRDYLFTFFNYRDSEFLSAHQNKINRARHVSNITANINAKLKIIAKRAGITKNVSTHIARHTFAKMAIDTVSDFNISMDLVGHSNIKEHQLYIREISQSDELDDAADKIFG